MLIHYESKKKKPKIESVGSLVIMPTGLPFLLLLSSLATISASSSSCPGGGAAAGPTKLYYLSEQEVTHNDAHYGREPGCPQGTKLASFRTKAEADTLSQFPFRSKGARRHLGSER